MEKSTNLTTTIVASATTAAIAAGATAYYLNRMGCTKVKAVTEKASTDTLTSQSVLEEQMDLFTIDYTMHCENRQKVFACFEKLTVEPHSAIILDGGDEVSKYDTDTCHEFYQESFFQYLFGVREPGCRGILDLDTKTSILLVERCNAEWELWCGKRESRESLQRRYKVDYVYYVDETAQVLKDLNVQCLYRVFGQNSDSGMMTVNRSEFPGIENFKLNDHVLHEQLVNCRLIKTEKEIQLLKHVNDISSRAHIEVMRVIKPNFYEFQSESTFLHYCYAVGGARLHAYTCICGSGNNASALHYGHAGAPNGSRLEDGALFLNDMGAQLHGYASDITCTFPVNGKFTPDQRMIYEGVLKSHDAVIRGVRAGVHYAELHRLSHLELTKHLLKAGFFQNGSIDELMENEISAYFYPHGLGHLMGLDVHDVGGYEKGNKRSTSKMFCKLRLSRELRENMVLTVEPGCYFIDAQLNELLANPELVKYVNLKMLERFRKTGGVRIESNVIVRKTYGEVMTKVPRTVAEIEHLMQTGTWSKNA